LAALLVQLLRENHSSVKQILVGAAKNHSSMAPFRAKSINLYQNHSKISSHVLPTRMNWETLWFVTITCHATH
jgi:hypothetical protein